MDGVAPLSRRRPHTQVDVQDDEASDGERTAMRNMDSPKVSVS